MQPCTRRFNANQAYLSLVGIWNLLKRTVEESTAPPVRVLPNSFHETFSRTSNGSMNKAIVTAFRFRVLFRRDKLNSLTVISHRLENQLKDNIASRARKKTVCDFVTIINSKRYDRLISTCHVLFDEGDLCREARRTLSLELGRKLVIVDKLSETGLPGGLITKNFNLANSAGIQKSLNHLPRNLKDAGGVDNKHETHCFRVVIAVNLSNAFDKVQSLRVQLGHGDTLKIKDRKSFVDGTSKELAAFSILILELLHQAYVVFGKTLICCKTVQGTNICVASLLIPNGTTNFTVTSVPTLVELFHFGFISL
mmetsp:Transcript_1418/g.3404  ORF Transcript_1418/g.3404 Transcript_1418/m.3404 type:complete len:310 (-) Transcript_1418:430-1359(-)